MVNHVDGKNYGLPDGWTVEQKSQTSLKYLGIKDMVSSIINSNFFFMNYNFFVLDLTFALFICMTLLFFCFRKYL